MGCCGGVDRVVWSAAVAAGGRVRPFAADFFGGVVSRSIALARFAAESCVVLVALPDCACPAGVAPSPRVGECFRGGGSGTWATAALAAGLGSPVLLWLAPPLSPPDAWSAVRLSGGWWEIRVDGPTPRE